jgi:hypothetical protein
MFSSIGEKKNLSVGENKVYSKIAVFGNPYLSFFSTEITEFNFFTIINTTKTFVTGVSE